jgi:hypothetical protein
MSNLSFPHLAEAFYNADRVISNMSAWIHHYPTACDALKMLGQIDETRIISENGGQLILMRGSAAVYRCGSTVFSPNLDMSVSLTSKKRRGDKIAFSDGELFERTDCWAVMTWNRQIRSMELITLGADVSGQPTEPCPICYEDISGAFNVCHNSHYTCRKCFAAQQTTTHKDCGLCRQQFRAQKRRVINKLLAFPRFSPNDYKNVIAKNAFIVGKLIEMTRHNFHFRMFMEILKECFLDNPTNLFLMRPATHHDEIPMDTDILSFTQWALVNQSNTREMIAQKFRNEERWVPYLENEKIEMPTYEYADTAFLKDLLEIEGFQRYATLTQEFSNDEKKKWALKKSIWYRKVLSKTTLNDVSSVLDNLIGNKLQHHLNVCEWLTKKSVILIPDSDDFLWGDDCLR